ncbi:MAG: hypothetical protein VXY90_13925, partial [Pseudomonadota bacterium]|nr:hypothetical protein [Pseudomonadota bacterium]
LAKNVDELTSDMQSLLASKVDGLIKVIRLEVLGGEAVAKTPRLGGGDRRGSGAPGGLKGMDSLTVKFQNQMAHIMGILRGAAPPAAEPSCAAALGTYERLATAESAHICTCGWCEPRADASAPSAPRMSASVTLARPSRATRTRASETTRLRNSLAHTCATSTAPSASTAGSPRRLRVMMCRTL